MRSYRDYRRDFSAGVVSEEYLGRSAGELTQNALKVGDNVFITQAGTIVRRPGSDRIAGIARAGRARVFDLPDGTFRFLVFSDLVIDVYLSDGTLDHTEAAPWVDANLWKMTVINENNNVIILHNDFPMQQLNYTASGGTWSLDLFSFRTDAVSNKTFSPVTRFEPDGTTLQFSGYSGSVTATFSSAFLTADYVGVHFIYGFASQVVVTAFLTATTATVTVIDTIFPTMTVTVVDGAQFIQGDAVQGDISKVRGVVSSKIGNVLTVVLIDGFAAFDTATPEELIGPQGASDIVTSVQAAAPAPINIWFEELISVPRGYPGTGVLHENRLCLGGFPAARNLLACSSLNAPTDFNVASGQDNDAIIERIGKDPNAKIKYLSSLEQLLIHTDRGLHYVPQGSGVLFTPSGIGFDFINTDKIADIPPTIIAGTEDQPAAAVYLDIKNRVKVANMTGTNRSAWKVKDITKLGYHLIDSPVEISFADGVSSRPESLIAVVNGDGTVAVFTWVEGSEQAGWVPWARSSGDRYHSLMSWEGELYAVAQVDTSVYLERIDFAAVIDSQFTVGYSGEVARLLQNRFVRSEETVPVSITVGDTYGHDFPLKATPAPMVIAQAGRQRKRAAEIWTDVIDTGVYRVEGEICTAYEYQSDPEAVPPINNREHKNSQSGSAYDRTIDIEQLEGEGSPFHLRGVSLKMRAR